MAHRFTIIFEKEERVATMFSAPLCPDAHTQSETIDEGIQTSAKRLNSTSRA